MQIVINKLNEQNLSNIDPKQTKKYDPLKKQQINEKTIIKIRKK